MPERFIRFLSEHYAGSFPLWLAPDQGRVITLNESNAIVVKLRANRARVAADYNAAPFKAKLSNPELLRV